MELDEWLATLAAEIGAGDVVLDSDAIQTLLDLARDAAHEVERVAAPLSTFLVGVAVGRGVQLEVAAAQASALALDVGSQPPTAAVVDAPTAAAPDASA